MTWSLVRDHAQVLGYDGRRLTLGLSTAGLTGTFRSGAHGEYVRQALSDVLGVDAHVDGVHTEAAPAARPPVGRPVAAAEPDPPPPPDDEPPPPPDPRDEPATPVRR